MQPNLIGIQKSSASVAAGTCCETEKTAVARCIRDHFNSLAQLAKTLATSSATVGAEALAILERERDAALARLDAVYAAADAASARWDETNKAEESALLAICAYRCTTLGESSAKFRYLLRFRDGMTEAQSEVLFASMAPEEEV